MERVARPVHAPIREQVRAHLVGQSRVDRAAHVETGHVQTAVGIEQWHERQVVCFFHHHQRRLLLAFVGIQVGQVDASAIVGDLAGENEPIFSPNLDGGAGHRFAALDGLHKDIARAVDGFLDQKTQVGHHYQAGIFHSGRVEVLGRGLVVIAFIAIFIAGPVGLGACGFALCRVVATYAEQEYAAPFADAVFQVLAEIDAFVMGFTRAQFERNRLLETLGHLVWREVVIEVGLAEAAGALGGQQMQLARQQASNFQVDAGQIAHQNGQSLVAIQGQ